MVSQAPGRELPKVPAWKPPAASAPALCKGHWAAGLTAGRGGAHASFPAQYSRGFQAG